MAADNDQGLSGAGDASVPGIPTPDFQVPAHGAAGGQDIDPSMPPKKFTPGAGQTGLTNPALGG